MPHKPVVEKKNNCRLLRDCVRIDQVEVLSADIDVGAAGLGLFRKQMCSRG